MQTAAKRGVIITGLAFLAALAVVGPSADPARGGALCARVNSKWNVVQEACRAIPELRSPGVTDVQATNLLRVWAAGWIDISSRTLLLEDRYLQQDVDSLYRHFNANDGGAFCGGTAWTLMRLYNAFGLDSWTYNAGPAPGMTHVVTLVRADGKIIVQDAYANYTLTERAGHPLDVRRLFALLDDHRAKEVVIRGEPTSKDYLLTTGELAGKRNYYAGDWPWGRVSNLRNCDEVRKGVSRCSIRGVSYGRLRFWSAWDDILGRLQRDGRPPNFLYLLTYPIGLASDVDGWTPPSDTRATPTHALLDELMATLAD